MRRLVVACTASLLACSQPAEEAAPARSITVVPAPSRLELHPGSFRLDLDATIAIPDDERVRENAGWIASLVNDGGGTAWQVSGESEAGIRLELISAEELRQQFAPQDVAIIDESYWLTIDADGVRIRASAAAGLYYGLATLWQLIAGAPADDSLSLPFLTIVDTPAFAWRGLMLDSARHYQSPEFIKRYIDWMSLYKLNVFHWHLTDDQAWRLEIRKHPRLTEVGAWRVPAGAAPAEDIDPATSQPRKYGGYYSQQTVREIVAHAASRHVTIVPEVDVPGHASAAIAAYPELGVEGHGITEVPARWGVYDNVFNLDESTLLFLEDVYREVVEMFPGEYIHVGGDEVVTRQWEESRRVGERMQQLGIADVQALQNYYVERLQGFLAGFGRKVIGWDEILESELPADAAVMSWRGIEGAIEAAAAGHKTVLSPAPVFYLDHLQTADANAPPGRGGVITTRDIYEFEVLPDSLKQNRQFLLGVQGNLWTEHVRTENRAAYMSYPRALAIAELAWTTGHNKSWDEFAGRLDAQSQQLTALGITAELLRDWPVAEQIRGRVEDRDMELCSNSIVLALEDDAPLNGDRESFLLDIMNPCWILRDADLGKVHAVRAAVGQVPFNFEIGRMIDDVVVVPPVTAEGELLVHRDDCSGPIIASLPLAPATGQHAVTELPAAPIVDSDETQMRADLCFNFTRHGIDPIWAIDWVELVKAPGEGAQ
ncbi:MAG TPA: beta-N-acetylhexosaminidase [Woeseiaceae bacterium]|nr:beta-N-acetylhexosaminidase [Woeseiaceae bacterium]